MIWSGEIGNYSDPRFLPLYGSACASGTAITSLVEARFPPHLDYSLWGKMKSNVCGKLAKVKPMNTEVAPFALMHITL